MATSESTEPRSCLQCGAAQPSARSDVRLEAASNERPSRHDCEDAARIPLTAEAVLELLRQHFADVDSIFVYPYVPPTKEEAARLVYVGQLPRHEPILALYDTQHVLDASVHEGFVVTPARICWKNPGEAAVSIPWSDLDPDHLYVDGLRLFLGSDGLLLTQPEVQDACANAFHVLALSGLPPRPMASGHMPARDTSPDLSATADEGDESGLRAPPRRSATPPPPHTTSYFAYASHAQSQSPDCSCWHCHTPLYESTPQCAFCGAEPKPTGWLRTG